LSGEADVAVNFYRRKVRYKIHATKRARAVFTFKVDENQRGNLFSSQSRKKLIKQETSTDE
jgi:hypothetical protein